MRIKFCLLITAVLFTIFLIANGAFAQAVSVRWDSDGTKTLTQDGWTLAGTQSDLMAKSKDYSSGQADAGTNGVWRINDNNAPANAYMRMYKDTGGMSSSQGIIMARVKWSSGSSSGKGTFGYSAGSAHSVVVAIRDGAVNIKNAGGDSTTYNSGGSVSVPNGTAGYRVYALRYYNGGVYDLYVSKGSDWSSDPSNWTLLIDHGGWTSQNPLKDETGTARTGLILGSYGDSFESWDGCVDYIAWTKSGDDQVPWNFNPAPPLDNAQLISNDIPTTMTRGLSKEVSVTMKNTGNTTWTADSGFSLVGSGTANLFYAPNKISLAPGDAIAPDQEKTFTFTMTAPRTLNTYTIGWRMAHGDANPIPFGDICVKGIDVEMGNLPPDPPTIILPASASLTGAPSVLVRWQGDAHDAYEVHIGSNNTPTSTDGWTSGVNEYRDKDNKLFTRTLWSCPSNDLIPQRAYYVFVRVRNANGWSDWSAAGRRFYVNGSFPTAITPMVEGDRKSDHSICYNPDRNEYLIAYLDVRDNESATITYRILDPVTGVMKVGTEEHRISASPGLTSVRLPSVCYNNVSKEYLLVYSGWLGTEGVSLHDRIYGLRIDSYGNAKGNGQPQQLGECGWLYDQALGFSTAKPGETSPDNVYLLAWYNRSGSPAWIGDFQVHGLFIIPNGDSGLTVGNNVRISSLTPNCYAPKIEYNSDTKQFLVDFEVNMESIGHLGDIYAQVVTPTGTLVGSNIPISTETAWDQGTDLVYAHELQKFLIVYGSNNGVGAVWGQFLNSDGTLNGSRFMIADSQPVGGWGPNVVWHPNRNEFLVSYCSSNEDYNYARRISSTGQMLCDPFRFTGNIVGGMGNFTPFPFANTTSNDYLICWHHSYGAIYTRRYAPLEAPANVFPPSPAANFNVITGNENNTLSWTNPTDGGFTMTRVVSKTTGYPTSLTDGITIYDGPGSSFTHSGLRNGVPYYYAAFAHNNINQYTAAALGVGTPWTSAKASISDSQFGADEDGWAFSTWTFDQINGGTIQRISDIGNPNGGIRATGYGITDDASRCLREGGEMSKTISTIGYQNILVSYDIKVNNLGIDNTGAGSGSCPVDHNLVDEQLTVYYSSNSGASWTEVENISRADLLANYRGYAKRQFSLSGLSHCNNNPKFALRFRWQFNTQTDTGDIDNVQVMGDPFAVSETTIPEAKKLGDGEVRTIKGSVVTGAFSGFFYIQDSLKPFGLKVIAPDTVAHGDLVDVTGVMGGELSERFIDCTGGTVDVIENPDPDIPTALFLIGKSLGGADLNALTPGILGGKGANNIGLLVKAFGKVTQRDTVGLQYFYVDDGSGIKDGTSTAVSPGIFEENIGVRVKENPTSYAKDSYVTVTGISTFVDGSLIGQILSLNDGVNTIQP